jgi:hypothetical protein
MDAAADYAEFKMQARSHVEWIAPASREGHPTLMDRLEGFADLLSPRSSSRLQASSSAWGTVRYLLSSTDLSLVLPSTS